MEPKQKNNTPPLHPASRLKSIRCAIDGILWLVKHEPNAKIHTLATFLVIVSAWLRHVQRWQWAALIVAIALVWVAEALNTCIERLCDAWCARQYHPEVGTIKDLAAGAVFIAAICSVAIAGFVFLS